MVVIIIDDQIHVVSGIISGIMWDTIGVNKVLKAYDAFEARELFLKNHIDVMLCDIEMPSENGLTLFKWVKEHFPEIECIFLTAHADFIYAKEALKYGAFDYILQPARYEDIQTTLQKAIKAIEGRRLKQEYFSFGRLLHRREDEFWNMMLQEWFEGKKVDTERMIDDLREMKIEMDSSSRFYFILLQLLKVNEEEKDHIAGKLRSIVKELFAPYEQDLLFSSLPGDDCAFLLHPKAGIKIQPELLTHQLERCISICREKMVCQIACYTGAETGMEEMGEFVSALQEMKNDNVVMADRVFILEEYCKSPKRKIENTVMETQINICRRYLYENNIEAGKNGVIQYLKELQNGRILNAEDVRHFFDCFLDMFFEVAEGRGISLRRLYENKLLTGKIIRENLDIEDMIYIVSHIFEYLDKAEDSPELERRQIDQILQYIHNNIEKDIRRSDLSKAVFLSQDYISRLFKKEMNMSLKVFITEEKMRVARNLLLTTHLPIGVIAVKVGYSNFSYFSQTYKKVMNKTPQEEREDK